MEVIGVLLYGIKALILPVPILIGFYGKHLMSLLIMEVYIIIQTVLMSFIFIMRQLIIIKLQLQIVLMLLIEVLGFI